MYIYIYIYIYIHTCIQYCISNTRAPRWQRDCIHVQILSLFLSLSLSLRSPILFLYTLMASQFHFSEFKAFRSQFYFSRSKSSRRQFHFPKFKAFRWAWRQGCQSPRSSRPCWPFHTGPETDSPATASIWVCVCQRVVWVFVCARESSEYLCVSESCDFCVSSSVRAKVKLQRNEKKPNRQTMPLDMSLFHPSSPTHIHTHTPASKSVWLYAFMSNPKPAKPSETHVQCHIHTYVHIQTNANLYTKQTWPNQSSIWSYEWIVPWLVPWLATCLIHPTNLTQQPTCTQW